MTTASGPRVLWGLGAGVLGLMLGGTAQASDPTSVEAYLAFGEGAELRGEVPTVGLLEDVCAGGESKATVVINEYSIYFPESKEFTQVDYDDLKLTCDYFNASAESAAVALPTRLEPLYKVQEAYKQIQQAKLRKGNQAAADMPNLSKAITPVSPSFQANFTAALADFLVARTGAELSAWAMSSAAGRICKEPKHNATNVGHPIRTAALLPETCDLLQNLEKWGGSTAIQSDFLRDAVESDMLTMARHLGAEVIRFASLNLENGKNKDDSIDAGLVMAVVGRMVEQVVAGADPAEAIASWAATRTAQMPTWTKSGDEAVGESLTRLSWTGQPLSSALYLVSEIAYVGDLKQASDDAAGAGPLGTTSFTYSGQSVGAALALATWYDRDALPTGFLVNEKEMSPESLKALKNEYSAVWSAASTNLAELASAWAGKWETARGATKEERMALVAERVSWAADLIKDLANLAMVLDGIVANPGTTSGGSGGDQHGPLKQLATLSTLSAMSEVVEHIAAGDTAAGVHDLMVLVPEVLKASGLGDEPWFEPVQRAAGLGADLSTAETSADMQAAMTQAAGKVGGYQDKRKGATVLAPRDRFYATLNGYVGVAGGMVLTEDWARQGYTVWPMAAVGPEFGMKLKGTNLSLQFPLLDVGNLAAARFTGAEDSEGVQVADVFTPGVQLGIGIPCTPLVAGVRGNLTPQETDGRYNVAATLSVDLALFP